MTPKAMGRPTASVVNPTSKANMAIASRIETSFLRVEMEKGTSSNTVMESDHPSDRAVRNTSPFALKVKLTWSRR